MDDWRIKYEAQEIARAIAHMIAEQTAHGATAEDIAALVKLMRDDNQESEANEIPDDAPPKAARSSPAATSFWEGRRPRPVVWGTVAVALVHRMGIAD